MKGNRKTWPVGTKIRQWYADGEFRLEGFIGKYSNGTRAVQLTKVGTWISASHIGEMWDFEHSCIKTVRLVKKERK